jgi:hypothetical protein
MPRTRRKEKESKDFNVFADEERSEEGADEELPKDEAGRRKIKKRYEELLGIRIEKLKGRVLNRERINKTIEGIYFICAVCKKICHNLDDGLLEDPDNVANRCGACAKEKGKSGQVAA